MDENFIQLLIWLIAHEISKDNGDDNDHKTLFYRMYDNLNVEYKISKTHQKHVNYNSHIELGKKIINFFYDHFTGASDEDSDDGAMKLLDIPLKNGEYKKHFRELNFIGDGSYGNVYRAENVLDHEHYAIKKVPLYGRKTEYYY
jgi:hypothetical protein